MNDKKARTTHLPPLGGVSHAMRGFGSETEAKRAAADAGFACDVGVRWAEGGWEWFYPLSGVEVNSFSFLVIKITSDSVFLEFAGALFRFSIGESLIGREGEAVVAGIYSALDGFVLGGFRQRPISVREGERLHFTSQTGPFRFKAPIDTRETEREIAPEASLAAMSTDTAETKPPTKTYSEHILDMLRESGSCKDLKAHVWEEFGDMQNLAAWARVNGALFEVRGESILFRKA